MCQTQTNGNYPGAPPVFELDEEGEPADGEEEEVLRRKFEEVCFSPKTLKVYLHHWWYSTFKEEQRCICCSVSFFMVLKKILNRLRHL